jgi:hypothetical protein
MYVTCRVCHHESQIAVATGNASLLGGVSVATGVMFVLSGHASAGITIGSGILAWLATSTAVNWLVLRLEPKDDCTG